MKIVVAEVLDTFDKTSAAGRPYSLTSFKGVDGELYERIYGKHKVGDEIELTRGEKGWDVVRVPGQKPAYTQAPKEFKADPIKQDSIEWQACLKAAVEAVHNYYTLIGINTIKGEEAAGLVDYKKDIVNTLITFKKAIDMKPEDTI